MKAARKYKASTNKTKTPKRQFLQKKEEISFLGMQNQASPFFSPKIQTKLIVGKPNDKYEQEADSMAKQVGKMPNRPFANTPQIQNKTNNKICCCPSCNLQRQEVSKPKIQTKKVIQSKAENEASNGLETTLKNTKGQGQTLPKETNLQMKQILGQDFSNVTIHTDNKSIQMNQELQSQAFTHGSDVYFNQGKYNPHSNDGQQLLAHELTHVVQQTGTAQKKPIAQTGGHRIQRGLWSRIKKGVKKIGKGIKKGFSKVGKGIKKGVSWLGGKAKNAFKWIGKKAKGAFGWLKSGAKKIGSWLKNTGSSAWKGLKSKVGKAWNWVKSKGKAGWSWLKSKGKWLWNGLKKAGKWLKKTAEADVICFGELHNNPIAHWLQYEFLLDLIEKRSSEKA